MKAHFFKPALVLALTTTLAAAEPEKSVRELMTDLQVALKQAGAAVSDQPAEGVPALTEIEAQLEKSLARGGTDALRLVATLRAATESKQILTLCDELTKRIAAECTAKEDAFLEKVHAALQQTADAARAAKNKTDLDAVLRNLNELQAQQTGDDSDLKKRGLDQVAVAQTLAIDWQKYLTQRSDGAPAAARAILQNLIEHCTYPILPRAEIQEKIDALPAASLSSQTPSAPEPAPKVAGEPSEPAEIGAALAQLKESDGNDGSKATKIAELEALGSFYEKVQAGLHPPLNLLGDDSVHFLPLRLKLTRLALPGYLGLPGDFQIEPDETVGHLLKRVMADAESQQNWRLFSKALEASQLLTGRAVDRSSQAAPTPWQSFIIGLNQDQAGQFALAVVSYQEALKDTENLVPVNVVRDKLAVIKKDHPQEFEEGWRMLRPAPTPGRVISESSR